MKDPPASTFLRMCVFTTACVCVCFSEQCIEAYELLLALAESEQGLVLGQFRAAGVSAVGERSHTGCTCAFRFFCNT